MIQKLLICFFLTSMAGCGFHLRGTNGTTTLPSWFNQVAIVIQNAHQELEPLLKAQLEAYHINVTTDFTKANYLLIISLDNVQEEITNIAASTAARQYILLYAVDFSVIKTKGEPIIPANHIMVSRRFTMNNDRVLGSNWAEGLINNEMRQEAAYQIITRLSRELKKPL